jgi:hypothetical protein
MMGGTFMKSERLKTLGISIFYVVILGALFVLLALPSTQHLRAKGQLKLQETLAVKTDNGHPLPTRTVPLNQTIAVPNGILIAEDLVLAPTYTAVNLRYQGNEYAPQLGREIRLKGTERRFEPRGAGGGSSGDGENWEGTYRLEFEPLEPLPRDVTLELAGLVYHKAEIRIPLSGERYAAVPDGRKVMATDLFVSGGRGETAISYRIDENNPFPFDSFGWRVVDDSGETYETEQPEIKSSGHVVGIIKPTKNSADLSEQEKRLRLSWELPEGRQAVALVIPGYWEYREDLGAFAINIPQE